MANSLKKSKPARGTGRKSAIRKKTGASMAMHVETEAVPAGRLFDGSRFHEFVRNHVVRGLVSKHNFHWNDARRMVDTLTDDEIDKEAPRFIKQMPFGKLGDGKILQWIIDHKAEIMALVEWIITIFAMV